MRTFSEFDVASGYFTGGRVSYSNALVTPSARPGFAWLLGEFNEKTQYVVSGNVLSLDVSGMAAFAAGPSTPFDRWDIASRRWIDTRDPAIVLGGLREAKIDAIKAEATRRIGLVLDWAGDPELFGMFRELWQSIAPAARQPTQNLTQCFAIYQAASNGIVQVKAAQDAAAISAVVVTWPA